MKLMKSLFIQNLAYSNGRPAVATVPGSMCFFGVLGSSSGNYTWSKRYPCFSLSVIWKYPSDFPYCKLLLVSVFNANWKGSKHPSFIIEQHTTYLRRTWFLLAVLSTLIWTPLVKVPLLLYHGQNGWATLCGSLPIGLYLRRDTL